MHSKAPQEGSGKGVNLLHVFLDPTVSHSEQSTRRRVMELLLGRKLPRLGKRLVRSSESRDPITQLLSQNVTYAVQSLCTLMHGTPETLPWDEALAKLRGGDFRPLTERSKRTEEVLPPLPLRDYQEQIARDITDHRGNALFVLPTGLGKTRILGEIIERDEQLKKPGTFVLLSTPTGELSSQHRDDFCSGKFGVRARELMQEGRFRIDTPQTLFMLLQKLLDRGGLRPDDVRLFLVDEGDIGTHAQTWRYAVFPIWKILAEAQHADLELWQQQNAVNGKAVPKLVATTATATESDRKALQEQLNITLIIDAETPGVREGIIRATRRKERILCHCEGTPGHHYVVKQLKDKLKRSCDFLREQQVHEDGHCKGFPYFTGENPAVSPDRIEELLRRLTAITNGTFGHVYPPRAQRSLAGLWRRWRENMPHVEQEEIKPLRRALVTYLQIAETLQTVECDGYADFMRAHHGARDRVLQHEAVRILAKWTPWPQGKDTDPVAWLRENPPASVPAGVCSEITKKLFWHEQVQTRLSPQLDMLGRAYANYSLDERSQKSPSLAPLHCALVDLAAEEIRDPRYRKRDYIIAHDPEFCATARAIQKLNSNGELHPKEHALRQLLEEEVRTKSVRTLITVRTRETLFRLRNLIDRWGYTCDFLIGGTKDPQVSIHNALARRRLEEGEVQMLIGTSVLERGFNLPALDLHIGYSFPASECKDIQSSGRVGRAGDGMSIQIAYTSDDACSRDMTLAHAKKTRWKTQPTVTRSILPQEVA